MTTNGVKYKLDQLYFCESKKGKIGISWIRKLDQMKLPEKASNKSIF